MEDNKVKGVIYMLISGLAFAFMSLAVRLSGDLPVAEKVFSRNFVSMFVAIYMVFSSKTKIRLWGKMENQKFLLSRSLLGLLGVALFFYAIDHITLTDANILSRLHPVFVTIFSCFFLKERISKMQVPSLIMVFIFAIMVIKPRFDLSIIPGLSAVGTAVCAGATYTIVRFLKGREEPATIVFYFSFVSVVVMLPFLIADFVMPTASQLFWLLGIGVFASFGQFGLTLAYKYAKAAEVSVYSYSTIIFAAILGFIFAGELPDVLSIIGGIGIIGTATLLFTYNKQKGI
jgi:drug/metabolite transporter (DMT)-like permease